MSCNTRWPSERHLNPERSLGIGLLAAALLLGTAAQSASAQTSAMSSASTAANTAPSAAPAQLPGSRLQGQVTLRYFGLRIYDAQLWTLPDFSAKQWQNQGFVLQLHYHRALKGKAIAERSLEEMRRAGPIPAAQAQAWLDAMLRIFPDVQAQEQIVGQHLPGQGARFWHQGRELGFVQDAAFARLFFGIWLAEHSSEPALRRVLLGQDSGKAQP